MLRFYQIDMTVWSALSWPIFSVFGPFLVPFTLLCSPKYKA
ncbi:hypothetical protein F383_34604 [Gossypium arboreum]|uniref:Uncharacterized protein n=1 Tax=Gossypium arboreum TaxID=29729 RepID=A0A0B0N8B2_GOSAR|nr:hypothetical protein F383_34604 [Gossypium arboreum]